MIDRPQSRLAPALVIACTLLAEPGAVSAFEMAEVQGPEWPSTTSAGRLPETAALRGEPVRARCWQEGVKVVDESGFTHADIGPTLRGEAITLHRGRRETVLLPLRNGFCSLTAE
jgi:hypothetical protein